MTTIFRLLARIPTSLNVGLASCFLVLFSSFGQTVTRTPDDITFLSQGHRLQGKFFHGATATVGVSLVLLHGFPGNPQDPLGLGQKLMNAGFNVLTFNYSGTHQSEGEFSLENTLMDIEAAYAYLHQTDILEKYHVDTTGIVLGGYSYGGGMSLTYAARHPEIVRVFSIAGTDHGEFAREYVRNREMARQIDTMFARARRPHGPVSFSDKEPLRKLAENPAPFDLRVNTPQLVTRDILLIGGWDDFSVTIDNHLLPLYRALKKAGATKIRFVTLQTDHSFRNVREELASELVRWIQSTPILPKR